MKNNQKNQKLSKKKLFLAALAVIILLLGGWFAYDHFVPRPLGNDGAIEYIGKEDYGCWYCDAPPTTLYYYTTDMRPPELVAYLKMASINTSEREKLDIVDSHINPKGFFMLRSPNREAFYIDYSEIDEAYIKKLGLKSPTKKYVFAIRAQSYQAAKDSR